MGIFIQYPTSVWSSSARSREKQKHFNIKNLSNKSDKNVDLSSDQHPPLPSPAQDAVPLQQARVQGVHHRPDPREHREKGSP